MRVRLFGRNAGVLVYRTDTGEPEPVLDRRVPAGDTVWTWDGTGEDGSSLPSGTYVVVAARATRPATSEPSPSPLPPKPAYGRALGGKGGVQIMSLAAAPPSGPVEATADAGFLVVNAGRRYAWQVRRRRARALLPRHRHAQPGQPAGAGRQVGSLPLRSGPPTAPSRCRSPSSRSARSASS